MFGDYVKMAAKAAAIVAGVAIITIVFNSITIPNLDLSQASTYLNTAYTIALHYVPGFAILWPLGIAVLTLEIALLGAKLGLIAIKWILKVNE